MIWRPLLIALLTFLTTACATSYHPRSLSGGFWETRVSENVFRVRFDGNGYTSMEQATDFTLLRSAEVTLEAGFTHFIIVEETSDFDVETYFDPGRPDPAAPGGVIPARTYTIEKPSSKITIVCFEEQPSDVDGVVFEAGFVLESISTKYGLTVTID